MKRGILVVVGVFLGVLLCVSVSEARPRGVKKLKHADRNRDGRVDKKEWKMEKKWEHKQREKAGERAKEKWEHKKPAEVKNWWHKRADANNDGVVDSTERSAWKKLSKERIDLNNDGVIDPKERRLSWRHGRSRVNTAVEKKYDANSDGWLGPDEVKEMLKDKQTMIRSRGKAKVDSAVEAEYDADNDGIIDATEAKAMKEDLD